MSKVQPTETVLREIRSIARHGLRTDGAHHKQYDLEQILRAAGGRLPSESEVERGIPA